MSHKIGAWTIDELEGKLEITRVDDGREETFIAEKDSEGILVVSKLVRGKWKVGYDHQLSKKVYEYVLEAIADGDVVEPDDLGEDASEEEVTDAKESKVLSELQKLTKIILPDKVIRQLEKYKNTIPAMKDKSFNEWLGYVIEDVKNEHAIFFKDISEADKKFEKIFGYAWKEYVEVVKFEHSKIGIVYV